jgi:hypothetical protein
MENQTSALKADVMKPQSPAEGDRIPHGNVKGYTGLLTARLAKIV